MLLYRLLRWKQTFFILPVFTILTVYAFLEWFHLRKIKAPKTRYRLPQFTNIKINLTQRTMLEDIHKRIWKQIRYLQEEGNCNEKKILHCENIGNYAGFGSMVSRYVVCIQTAFALGRMFFIHQEQYQHFGGIFRFLADESSRCKYVKDLYAFSSSSCNMHDRTCYLDNGYEINNTYKVLEFNTELKFPYARRIPGTIPRQLERELIALNIKEPWLWFSSQFVGYLLLRLKPEMKDLIDWFKKDMRLTYPLLSIHVRHTDKLISEADYVKEERFLKVADIYYETFFSNDTKRRLYIASDDKNIMKKIRILRPDFEFYQLQRKYVDPFLGPRLYGKKNFPKEILESIIIEFHFLTYSNFTLCTYSSNVCRLVWSLKACTPPYIVDNRIFSVEEEKRLTSYTWWGYGAPFTNDWVPIRASNLDMTFPDGTRMMRYTTGMLFRVQGTHRNITIAGDHYLVVYATTVWYESGPLSGYVLTKDIVRWPGNPSYHFYP